MVPAGRFSPPLRLQFVWRSWQYLHLSSLSSPKLTFLLGGCVLMWRLGVRSWVLSTEHIPFCCPFLQPPKLWQEIKYLGQQHLKASQIPRACWRDSSVVLSWICLKLYFLNYLYFQFVPVSSQCGGYFQAWLYHIATSAYTDFCLLLEVIIPKSLY